ncbi:hypothetical protein X975_15786, partial [Stegodyphus mimosarum]
MHDWQNFKTAFLAYGIYDSEYHVIARNWKIQNKITKPIL